MSTGLAIIIVNWNSKDYVARCVEAIGHSTLDVGHEIIVIDSGSSDGCGELLRRVAPTARFIQSADNVGFAAANNIAARTSRSEWLLFLNPDTEVTPAAIQQLLAAARSLDNAGILGARLLNTDGTLQTSCVMPFPSLVGLLLDSDLMLRIAPNLHPFQSALSFEESREPARVDAVSGACMLVRRSVFKQIGEFSEDYFMYCEDIDLCHAAVRHGYCNYYVPSAEIIHHGGGSSSVQRSWFSTVMRQRAIFIMMRKLQGAWQSAGYRICICAIALARLSVLACARLVPTRSNRFGHSMSKWLAIFRWSIGLEGWSNRYPDRPKAV
jgi:GT2 family glycosyltransferase